MDRVVQPHPFRRAPVALTLMSLVIGGIVAFATAREFALPVPLIAGAATAVVVFAATVGGLRLAYPPVTYDERDGVLRAGLRRVPVASITAVLRKLAIGTASAGLTYRLVPQRGRPVRVLIASSAAVRGLDRSELEALLAALERSSVPASLDLDHRAQLEAMFRGSSRQEPIGMDAVRADLSDEPSEPIEPAARAAAPTGEELRLLAESWVDDDEAALRVVETRLRGPRIASWCALATVGLVVVVWIGLLFTLDSWDDQDLAVAFGAGGLPVALLAYLTWDALVDHEVRVGRRLGREWMRDPEAARRGLPVPFHAPWLRSNRNLVATLAFIAQPIGALLLIFAIFFVVEQREDVPGWVPIAMLGVVALFAALGVLYLVWARRAKRADAAWLAAAAGPRFGV